MDQVAFVVFGKIFWRTEMEMVAQTSDVVTVWMRQEENINVQTTLFVARKPILKIGGHIVGPVVGIIRSPADIDVDQDVLAIVKFDKGHIPIVDREERE